jgi:hypothetical protein
VGGGWGWRRRHSLELISFALTGRTFGNQTKQWAARLAADRRSVPQVTPPEDAAIRKACALDGQLHAAATALLKARAFPSVSHWPPHHHPCLARVPASAPCCSTV